MDDKTIASYGRKWIQILFTFVVCVIIFIVLFSRVDIEKVVRVLKEAQLQFILPALLISIISIILAAYKWRILLKMMGCNVFFSETLFIYFGNTPMRSVTPLKIGTFALAVYLKKYKGFAFTSGASSIVLDKAYNLLALVIFIPIGLMFFDCPVVYKIFSWTFFLLLFYGVFYLFSPLLYRFLGAVSPKLGDLYEDVHHVIVDMTLKQRSYPFCLAVIMQGALMAMTYLIFKALNVSVPFYWVFLFVPLITSISFAPITVLGLGTREAAVLFFFSPFAGPEVLLSAGILLSLIAYIFIAFIGCFFVYSFTRKLLA